jgi:phospholipase C
MGSSAAQPLREAGSLPFPESPIGTVNELMPFDHLVVVMMENHSFDNLLGALSRTRSDVDGLSFDSAGDATNSNPGAASTPPQVTAFRLQGTAQSSHVTQSWKATHQQIDPNRRFLLAGTAYGGTVTGLDTLLDPPPAHGTIFDRLAEQHISWGDYFTDVPMTTVIPSIILEHLDHHHRIGKFFEDCQSGSLPSVSFVDPAIGAFSSIAAAVASLPTAVKDALRLIGADFQDLPPDETEEDPHDMYDGELWAHKVLEAVLRSPSWERTLLIYTYDEHGGYYDHVSPPAAIAPDDIPPKLQPGDPAGGYTMYGPRVPAVVVSPYSRPAGVSSEVHDHTSVLATIEHKWNLPALTKRDANAATVMGCLDLENAALLHPPTLQAPSETGPSGPAGTAG